MGCLVKKTLSRLREENRRLRRENAYLRYRLGLLGERVETREASPIASRFAASARMAATSHGRTYLGYLLGRLRESLAFRLWDRTRFAVRGFFFVSKLWSFFVWIFAILGFGTQFVLLVGAMAVLLPAAGVAALALWIVSIFSDRRYRSELRRMLGGRGTSRVYFVFLPKGWETHDYFCTTVALLEREGIVLLVSPSLVSCGFRGFRRMGKRRAMLHIRCYFSLRKEVFAQRVICIY